MKIEVKAPIFPPSVEDGTLTVIHAAEGQEVRRDDLLCEVETDKVVLEIPVPADGKVLEYKVKEDETVTSGQVIAIFEEGEVSLPKKEVTPPQNSTSYQKSSYNPPPRYQHNTSENQNVKLVGIASFLVGAFFGGLLTAVVMLMTSPK